MPNVKRYSQMRGLWQADDGSSDDLGAPVVTPTDRFSIVVERAPGYELVEEKRLETLERQVMDAIAAKVAA